MTWRCDNCGETNRTVLITQAEELAILFRKVKSEGVDLCSDPKKVCAYCFDLLVGFEKEEQETYKKLFKELYSPANRERLKEIKRLTDAGRTSEAYEQRYEKLLLSGMQADRNDDSLRLRCVHFIQMFLTALGFDIDDPVQLYKYNSVSDMAGPRERREALDHIRWFINHAIYYRSDDQDKEKKIHELSRNMQQYSIQTQSNGQGGISQEVEKDRLRKEYNELCTCIENNPFMYMWQNRKGKKKGHIRISTPTAFFITVNEEPVPIAFNLEGAKKSVEEKRSLLQEQVEKWEREFDQDFQKRAGCSFEQADNDFKTYNNYLKRRGLPSFLVLLVSVIFSIIALFPFYRYSATAEIIKTTLRYFYFYLPEWKGAANAFLDQLDVRNVQLYLYISLILALTVICLGVSLVFGLYRKNRLNRMKGITRKYNEIKSIFDSIDIEKGADVFDHEMINWKRLHCHEISQHDINILPKKYKKKKRIILRWILSGIIIVFSAIHLMGYDKTEYYVANDMDIPLGITTSFAKAEVAKEEGNVTIGKRGWSACGEVKAHAFGDRHASDAEKLTDGDDTSFWESRVLSDGIGDVLEFRLPETYAIKGIGIKPGCWSPDLDYGLYHSPEEIIIRTGGSFYTAKLLNEQEEQIIVLPEAVETSEIKIYIYRVYRHPFCLMDENYAPYLDEEGNYITGFDRTAISEVTFYK